MRQIKLPIDDLLKILDGDLFLINAYKAKYVKGTKIRCGACGSLFEPKTSKAIYCEFCRGNGTVSKLWMKNADEVYKLYRSKYKTMYARCYYLGTIEENDFKQWKRQARDNFEKYKNGELPAEDLKI